ncbi:hypothetical protein VFPPC_15106 [Pochonia chlamydosporia 170]|uniref:Uncharacterized protein n=1 Tax=Pochonia chlamydosporia 170 TaxID=1380566 RepID=A0A179G5B0_METCM|nr:hypothetical protein VFPPC_15106 [Pochonia chlamydosporia 170]OAQ72339.1 hypothetical protein VFPPC_15106 [Pochonia chlamydosporia 170]
MGDNMGRAGGGWKIEVSRYLILHPGSRKIRWKTGETDASADSGWRFWDVCSGLQGCGSSLHSVFCVGLLKSTNPPARQGASSRSRSG